MSSDITDDFKFTNEFTVISNLLSKNIHFCIPEPSYKIISEAKDSSSIYNELDYEILPIMPFSKYNIPFWIKVSLHSITYKKNKNIIVCILKIMAIKILLCLQKKLFFILTKIILI